MNFTPLASIGQDSHRFGSTKENPLILGGVTIPDVNGLLANSDGDVIIHSITNAISGLTCINILGSIADELCLKDGIKDSSVFLKAALEHLVDIKLTHLSVSIECKEPKISPFIPDMRKNLSLLLSLPESSIGITATSGEGLTDVGKGFGISVISILSAVKNS